MTDLTSQLEALERHGWEALSGPEGADFYADLMSDDGLMVFPGMTADKDTCIAAIRAAEPWQSWTMDEIRVLDLGDGAGVITYLATAQRANESTYNAYMSSTYARRDGRWQLILHQQSPATGFPEQENRPGQ